MVTFYWTAHVLQKAEKLGLSEPERILAVITILVGGMGINYLQDQEGGLRFLYIRQADDAKPTLFYTGTFILRTLDDVKRKYGLVEAFDSGGHQSLDNDPHLKKGGVGEPVELTLMS